MVVQTVATATIRVAVQPDGTGKVLETSNHLQIFPPEIEHHYFDKNDQPNEYAVRAEVDAFVYGIAGNIHYAHQKGLIDSAAHLREVIRKLEDLFIQNPEIEVRY